MIKNVVALSFIALSSLIAPQAYCGDLGAAAGAAAKFVNVEGNAAVGVNTGTSTIKANSSGKNSVANAGLAVVDSNNKTGKGVNIAVGVNTGTANIDATAKSGGTANAGLGVVHTGN